MIKIENEERILKRERERDELSKRKHLSNRAEAPILFFEVGDFVLEGKPSSEQTFPGHGLVLERDALGVKTLPNKLHTLFDPNQDQDQGTLSMAKLRSRYHTKAPLQLSIPTPKSTSFTPQIYQAPSVIIHSYSHS